MNKTYCMKCMMPNEGYSVCPHCGYAGEGERLPHVLKPGTILRNQYLLGEPLGQGGFGITYIGRDLNLDIRVAVKEYFPSGYAVRNAETSDQVTITDERLHLDVQKGKDSFLKEARTLAQFKGTPGIVDVLNFFEANDTAYIVMEYLDGETLAHRLKREPFNTDDIFRLMDPVFDTLEKIHKQGIVHRNISPDNIMMLPDGRLKLMDFGAARLMNYSDQRSVSVVLKAGYAPLEQYSTKGEQGPWTDIYALCATIYKCITKITPPDAHDRLMGEEIRWPSELGIPISIRQEAVLKKGMEIRQKDRFQTIGELQAALREETSGSAEIGPITWKPLPKDATVALPKEQSVQPMKEEPDKEATSKTTSDTGLSHNERRAEPKQPENKKKPAIWAVCATLVLAAAALGIVLLTGRDKQKPTEETVSAQTTIQSALFSTVQATFEPSAVGTENVSEESNPVLTEMPALTPFSMPDLMGKTMEEAYEIIVELGLVCSDVTQERNIEYSGGQIIRQSPDAGGLVYQGTSVSIVVTPVDQLTDAERIDKRRFSVVSSSDSSSKFLCAFADRNDRLWKWDSISKEVVSTGIVGIKELTQSLYYFNQRDLVLLNNSGEIVIVNLSEDLEIQTSTIKTLYCPSKITHIACNAEYLYAIGENGIVYRYTAMYDGPKTIEGIPPIDDIQCVGTDCTVVAKTKEGEYYGWASEDIFGALIPSDQDFKPDVPVRLDIEDGLKHVQFFENAGEHAILFMCVDKNDTATVYDNEKKPLKTVYDCVYTSSGPCCVWIASSDGQVRSYGTYVSGARLPRIADGPKRMISSIGWITIVVYENNSIMMTGQSWERELYFTSEDNTLFYLQ